MKLFNIVFVVLMATVAACGATDDTNTDSQEPVTTDSDTSTTSNTMPLQCDELSVEQCLDGPECRYISAREIHNKDTVPCVDWSQEPVAKGCLSNDMGCGEAETYAAPSDDPSDCWWFPDTCVPTGWGACETLMMVEECDAL